MIPITVLIQIGSSEPFECAVAGIDKPEEANSEIATILRAYANVLEDKETPGVLVVTLTEFDPSSN